MKYVSQQVSVGYQLNCGYAPKLVTSSSQIIVATKLQRFRKLYLTATMASHAPMIVLEPKFRSACRDGKLKTIIATVESRTEADTKLSPDIFSVMMAEAALNNHVDVVSNCLSNGGSVSQESRRDKQDSRWPVIRDS